MSWPTVALGEIFEIARGGSPRPIDKFITDSPDGVNWISIRDASNSSKYITRTEKRIRKSGVSKSREVKPGDFLLTNSMSFGRPYILQTHGCIHDGWLVLSGNHDVVDQDYFYHLLGSDLLYRKFESLAAGAVVKNLNTELVKKVTVPLPPLPEQRRIAAILDKADALRTKRREAIAKLDQLLQSVFLDMFGDPVINPKGWPMASLDSLFDIARGGSPRPIDAYITDAEDGVNWIMIGDTVEGSKYIDGTRKKIRKEGVSKSRSVKPGDFLLTNSMSFGRPYILRTSGCIHDGWLVLSPKDQRTHQDYLHSALAAPSIYTEFARRAPGATVKNLNIDLVSGVEIPVPPSSLQQQFAEAAQGIEAQATHLKTHLKQLDDLFASLQNSTFEDAP